MKKSEMWARRIISTALLVAILAGLVWLVIWVIGIIVKPGDDRPEPMSEPSAEESLETPPCKPSDLRVRIEATPQSPEIGQGTEITMTVRNAAGDACELDAADLHLRISDSSGIIWDPIQCGDIWDKPLLLSKNLTWSGKVAWDGKVYSECKPVSYSDEDDLFAGAGTYQLYVDYSGTKLERIIKLEIKGPEVVYEPETEEEQTEPIEEDENE